MCIKKTCKLLLNVYGSYRKKSSKLTKIAASTLSVVVRETVSLHPRSEKLISGRQFFLILFLHLAANGQCYLVSRRPREK